MKDDTEMSLLGRLRPKKKGSKAPKEKVPKGPPMETNYVPFDWKRMYSKKYIPLWILLVVFGVAAILIAVFQDKIVDKLRPWSDTVRDIPAGWLIPVAILFVLSFPPLIGDEIVEILCGVIYGLWIGFGVVALGTYLGQIGNWFAFKYALRRKAAKLERSDLNFGAMARMVRDSGLWLLIVIRVSAIPPHFSTAVFSTCDVKFWHFLVSTFFSLPKQIFLVYLGTLLIRTDAEKEKENKEDKKQNIAQTAVMFVILAITVVMAVYLWRKMKAIKIVLLEEQEQRRRAKLGSVGEGRDEEEGLGGEWSSSMQDDVRNDDYQSGGVHGAVPPPYDPQPLGLNADYYNSRVGGTDNQANPFNDPQSSYNDRRY